MGASIGDLAWAVAQDVTDEWGPAEWRAAKRGLRPHQRARIRDLAESLAWEWSWLGDMPVDTMAYARILQREVPRHIRTMARAWRPAPRE